MDNFIKKFTPRSYNRHQETRPLGTTYSPDELIEVLRANHKVENVKVCLKESFSDEEEINYIWVVVKSHFNHGEFVKSIKITLLDDSMYEVRIQLKKDPMETLIKDIYKKCVIRGREWNTGTTPIDKITFSMKIDADTLFKLVNWKHSIVNK